MKRIRLGASHKALAVLTSVAAGAAVVYGCIPSPDTSGLPPYDAGPSPNFDANIISSFDAGDANIVTGDDAGSQDSGGDSGPGTGTIVGVVIDYTEGNGSGVVPGATVTVLNGPQTTTDADGTFTLKNVPAGSVQLNVGKATDTTNDIAYSTTQSVLTVTSGQTVSVLPVLHEGCFEIVSLSGTILPTTYTDSAMQCAFGTNGTSRSAAYAALTYTATSFTDPASGGGGAFTGMARIEMIPIAFPLNASSAATDFSWAVGLPGASTPVETIGAVQIRVIDNATGDPLTVRTGDSVGVTIATSRTFTAPEGFALYSYDSAGGAWNAVTGTPTTSAPTPGSVDDGQISVGTTTTVPTLNGSWLALTKPAQATSCVTGTLTTGVTSAPAAGVVVRGVGATYVGTSSAVTDANGKFCLPVAAAPTDGGTGPSVQVAAGSLDTSGTLFAVAPTAPTPVTTQTATCATPASCTALGSISLVPVNGGCLSGTVSANGTTLPSTLNVEIFNVATSTSQRNAGIQQYAYLGAVTPDDAGSFCAPIVPGVQIQLVQPATNPADGCSANLGTAQVSSVALTCGAGDCLDAGAHVYDCP